MKTQKLATVAAAAALLTLPALAFADPGNGNGPKSSDATTPTTQTTPTTPTTPETTPTTPPATTPGKGKGPKAGSKAKAYGFYCQGQSKKHVRGTKGTPFSQCVHAMKALDKGDTASPKKACKSLSKKHVAGTKGTPFSRCVSGGEQLLADKQS